MFLLTGDFDKDILGKNSGAGSQKPEFRRQPSAQSGLPSGLEAYGLEAAPEGKPGVRSERKETGVIMTKDREKTIRTKRVDLDSYKKGKAKFSSTQEMSPKTFIGKITATRHAFLEMMGEKKERIFLGENEIIIGRIPDCDIQLLVENVSRIHARIIFKDEEYQVEDLGSTNGVYVNGIKVERCVLRQHDIIEIGGVKMQYIEEKIGQDHDLK